MTKHSAALIDLSHIIEEGLITYKGLPAPVVCDFLSREDSREFYEEGTEFQIAKVEMVANTGTYVDCPFHRFSDGKDLSETALARFVDLEAIRIKAHFTEGIEITEKELQGRDLKGKAVLIETGWDSKWKTDAYFENNPYLTKGAAEYLKDSGVTLVGIDSHNIDDTRGNSRPVHTVLLRNDILIVEHLCNLHSLPDEGFTFTAVPPKFKGVGTFPVRAFAMLNSQG